MDLRFVVRVESDTATASQFTRRSLNFDGDKKRMLGLWLGILLSLMVVSGSDGVAAYGKGLVRDERGSDGQRRRRCLREGGVFLVGCYGLLDISQL